MNVSSVCELEYVEWGRTGSSRCVMSDSDEVEGYGVGSTELQGRRLFRV